MHQPPVAVVSVMAGCTVLILFGEQLMAPSLAPVIGCRKTFRGATFGPEIVLWALAMVVFWLVTFVLGRAWSPYSQMVSHGVAEFYIDLCLRCAVRMLDATCEAADQRYEE